MAAGESAVKMPSIESIGHPLAFRVRGDSFESDSMPGRGDELAIRLEARALEGMQKEALVYCGPTATTWRMVSDEGPYLNGTDLAPFPLAFYAAGMAFSMLSEIERHAADLRVSISALSLEQHNFYTMQGSAIRGDMLGGAKPSELLVKVKSEAAGDRLVDVVRRAEASSPPQAYMRHVLANTFSLESNGIPVPVEGVHPSPAGRQRDPDRHFDRAQPDDAEAFLPDIISKLETAETLSGVEGGAGSSLKSEQKRTLHVHTTAELRADRLREARVRLLKPIGSTFQFVSDEAGEVAPPSLGYLAAGVGFCYMTQLGRYAQIVKQDLPSYRIVQQNRFELVRDARQALAAKAKPVDTQLYVNSKESEQAAQRLLYMGERTCFLHAAMRSEVRSRLQAEINGELHELE